MPEGVQQMGEMSYISPRSSSVTDLSSSRYMCLGGVTQDESSTDPKMAYEHLQIHNGNDTTNENNMKLSLSDTYLGPSNIYTEVYLVPTQEAGKIHEYQNTTIDTKTVESRKTNEYKNMTGEIKLANPVNYGDHRYITVIGDDKPEGDSARKPASNSCETSSQLRALPELPFCLDQYYEEPDKEKVNGKAKVFGCWTRRRLVILIASIVGALCVILAIAFSIALTTTRGKTSSVPSAPGPSPDPISFVSVCSNGTTQSGVYTLRSNSSEFNVYCDMETDGGGWLVFLRRKDGSQDFFRGWADYKAGFGSLVGEFYLGNDKLHQLTSGNSLYRLRVDLEAFNGTKVYAQYENFRIASEDHKYSITFVGFLGTAGDSLTWHYGLPFTTLDSDNDLQPDDNCAVAHQGAWWYNACYQSNLNGVYFPTPNTNDKGVVWRQFELNSLKFAEMKIKKLT